MNTRIEELKIRLIKLDTKITFYKTEIVKGHDVEENEMLLKNCFNGKSIHRART